MVSLSGNFCVLSPGRHLLPVTAAKRGMVVGVCVLGVACLSWGSCSDTYQLWPLLHLIQVLWVQTAQLEKGMMGALASEEHCERE